MENSYKPLFWAIVELFGHQIIAGEVSEQAIGSETFIRVDIPSIEDESIKIDGFTKMYSKGAIYSITPTDQKTCLKAIAGLQPKPVELWRLSIPRLPDPEER
jgi:hypothetical protein